MITILAIGPSASQLPALACSRPSVEILTAAGAEEALEKLARNRRIDAVLLLQDAPVREIAEMIHEEDPASPPLFGPAGSGSIPRVHPTPDGTHESLIDFVIAHLSDEGG